MNVMTKFTGFMKQRKVNRKAESLSLTEQLSEACKYEAQDFTSRLKAQAAHVVKRF